MNKELLVVFGLGSTLLLAGCGNGPIVEPAEVSTPVNASDVLQGLTAEQLSQLSLRAQEAFSQGIPDKDVDKLVLDMAAAFPKGETEITSQGYSDYVPTKFVDLNPLEKRRCDSSAAQCAVFLNDGLLASNWIGYATQGMKIHTYWIDNEGDAFRHTVWNALLTKHLGKATAKAWTDAHEYGSTTQVVGSIGSQMDFYNNSVGREVGEYYRNYSDQYLGKKVIDKIVAGQVRIVKRAYDMQYPITGNQLVPSNTYRATAWPVNYPNNTYFATVTR